MHALRRLEQAAHDAAFGVAQRRESSLRETDLQIAKVVLPQRHIVNEVRRALAPVGRDTLYRLPHPFLEVADLTLETNEVASKADERKTRFCSTRRLERL